MTRAEIAALRKRIAELEQQLSEVEGYPGNAADMLRLQKRVEELEEALKECEDTLTDGYFMATRRKPTLKLIRNALTPPATEAEAPRFSAVVAADGSGVISEGSIVADSRTGKIVGVAVKVTEAQAPE